MARKATRRGELLDTVSLAIVFLARSPNDFQASPPPCLSHGHHSSHHLSTFAVSADLAPRLPAAEEVQVRSETRRSSYPTFFFP